MGWAPQCKLLQPRGRHGCDGLLLACKRPVYQGHAPSTVTAVAPAHCCVCIKSAACLSSKNCLQKLTPPWYCLFVLQAAAFMKSQIDDAYDKWTTGFYDYIQSLQNKIP